MPSKKYNVVRRTTIEKMSLEDETMMYPNPNFQIYFPTVTLPEESSQTSRSSCVRVGAFLVIKKCIEDYQLFNRLNYLDERGKASFIHQLIE
ncbi:MAG: hypothetical protein R3Y24_12525 [Eubacteriales bacterium]